MRYKKFGNTGLFVSELCLGTMTFGGQGELWSKIGQLPQEEANRLVGRALEAGVNFIDTADVYSEGRSETITGQALRDLKVARDEVVIATKVFGQTGAGPNARGNSRYHIMEGVKRSLRGWHRPYRSVPDPWLRSGHADRGNRARAGRPGAPGPCALRRRVELVGLADHEGAGHCRAPRPGALRVAAGLLHRRGP